MGRFAYEHLGPAHLKHVKSGMLRPVFPSHTPRSWVQLALMCMAHDPCSRWDPETVMVTWGWCGYNRVAHKPFGGAELS